MLPLTCFFCDVLPARNDDPRYYKVFLSQYTLMSVPIIISQGALSPGQGEDPTAGLDEDVDLAIAEIPKHSSMRRKLFEVFTFRELQNVPPMPQTKEDRTFVSDLFYDKAKQYNLTNREMIIGALNAYAFTNYFALLEDTLQKIHYDIFGNQIRDDKITGQALIPVCLKEILDHKKINAEFTENLAQRSEFYVSFGILRKVWELINYMRNNLVHFGGRVSKKALETMQEKINSVTQELIEHKANYQALEFSSCFLEIENNIKKTGLLQFNNSLENIMRNTCISITESLLICDRGIALKKAESNRQGAKQPQKNKKPNRNTNRNGQPQSPHSISTQRVDKPKSSS